MSEQKKRKILIRPFIYINHSIGWNAIKIAILLGIQLILLACTKSWSALLVIFASTIGAFCAETISNKITKYHIQDHYSTIISIDQGLIAGMLIPQTFSPIAVFFLTVCVMLVMKHFFGGFSYAWANPSIFSVIVLWIVGYALFPSFGVTTDILAMRNPSQFLIENGFFPIYKFDSSLTEVLNNSVFSIFKVSIPEGYMSIFWDTQSIIPAFRFNFATLISSLFLFSDNFVKTIIPGCFLFVYMLLVRFVSPFFFNGVMFQGDMLLALLTSGTLFCAVFLIPWYGTVPITIWGKIIYGSLSGVIAFFMTGCGTSPCGTVATVLIANIISIIIQQYENRTDRLRVLKMVGTYKNNTD